MKELKYDSIHDKTIYTIRVGGSAEENWNLIDRSKQNDIWFHVDGMPSCHVVLEMPDKNKPPNRSVIKYCAILCKNGSKSKDMNKVSIIYTKIKNVKKSDVTGSVTTKNTKVIKI
jgi:predicted ribosome quality control (RQC) complex YloA/Tae2 family protein